MNPGVRLSPTLEQESTQSKLVDIGCLTDILFYSVLFYSVLFHSTLLHSSQFYSNLSYSVLNLSQNGSLLLLSFPCRYLQGLHPC